MNQDDLKQRLKSCRVVAELMARKRADWSRQEKQTFDRRLVELADAYWEASEQQRAEVRGWFNDLDCWPLASAIRGFAPRMRSKEDVAWLRRGLALAAIEDYHTDYRDLIVSLVILRYGAERVGIETAAEFDAATTVSTDRIHPYLKNARNHADKDIKDILRLFGYKQWAEEIP